MATSPAKSKARGIGGMITGIENAAEGRYSLVVQEDSVLIRITSDATRDAADNIDTKSRIASLALRDTHHIPLVVTSVTSTVYLRVLAFPLHSPENLTRIKDGIAKAGIFRCVAFGQP
jgi:hypothetical protein